ncbi:uncharacterized protein N7459_004206 [Penicillium hispanicum]|uniref:uncharacterized protein n=1 Tax=Penicillium hispanicum TaxID=1080232 RepID=UPI0025410A8F|nr:uncharacterized protein N7459_004206 [Penicillium hispanicum]KAJ5584406.1 hypothetical protein N7459_004206 [Penicillium hispanicum]
MLLKSGSVGENDLWISALDDGGWAAGVSADGESKRESSGLWMEATMEGEDETRWKSGRGRPNWRTRGEERRQPAGKNVAREGVDEVERSGMGWSTAMQSKEEKGEGVQVVVENANRTAKILVTEGSDEGGFLGTRLSTTNEMKGMTGLQSPVEIERTQDGEHWEDVKVQCRTLELGSYPGCYYRAYRNYHLSRAAYSGPSP